MNILLLILGILIQIIVIVDIFKTVIYINGGGFLSGFASRAIWKLFFTLAKGDARNRILNLCGSLIMLFLLFMWINLIWLSYSLIYISDFNSVINNATNSPAGNLDKIYFVGYTLTSLGNGDFSAGSDAWQIITNVVGMNSLVFISLGIAYLIPVLEAVIDKRTLAVHINKLGSSPVEIIMNGFNGENFDPLYQRFYGLENLIIKHGERHLAYPILHYFHSNRRDHALTLSLAMLDEAITIQQVYKIDKSSKNYHWQVMRGALENLYDRLDHNYIPKAKEVPPFDYKNRFPTEFCKNFIHDTSTDIHKFDQHRQRILGYIENDGWDWEDVIKEKTEINVFEFTRNL